MDPVGHKSFGARPISVGGVGRIKPIDPDDDETDPYESLDFMTKFAAGQQIMNPLALHINQDTDGITKDYSRALLLSPEPKFSPVQGYEPSDDEITPYGQSGERVLDYLYNSKSPQEFSWRKNEVSRMQEVRRIDERGGGASIFGRVVGAVGNPALALATIVPISGPFTWGRVAKEVFAVTLAESVSEYQLYHSDVTRTKWEVATNIIGAGAITAILGSGIKYLTRDQLRDATKKFVDDVFEPPPPPEKAPGKGVVASREVTGATPEGRVATDIAPPLPRVRPGPDAAEDGVSARVGDTPDAAPGARSAATVAQEPPTITWTEAVDLAKRESDPEPVKFPHKDRYGRDDTTRVGEEWQEWQSNLHTKAAEILAKVNRTLDEAGQPVAAKEALEPVGLEKAIPETPKGPSPDEQLAVAIHANERINDLAKQYGGDRKAMEARIRYLSKNLDEDEAKEVLSLIDNQKTKDPNWNLALMESAVEKVKGKRAVIEASAEADKLRVNLLDDGSLSIPRSTIGELGAEKGLIKFFESVGYNNPVPLSMTLQTILDGAKSPAVKWLVRKLLNLDLDVPLTIVRGDELKAVGVYRTRIDTVTGATSVDPGTREIIIRAGMNDDDLVRIVLHESVHAATVHALTANNAFARAVNRLWKQAVELAEKEGIVEFKGVHYGLTNVEEFISEAFTKVAFQKWLKGHTVENTTIWEQVKELIGKAIGLGKTPGTLFDEVMKASDPLFLSESQILKGGSQRLPSQMARLNAKKRGAGDKEISMTTSEKEFIDAPADSTPASTSSVGDIDDNAGKLNVPDWLAKGASVGNPNVRLATSPSAVVRQVNAGLNEQPIRTTDIQSGIKQEDAVETHIKRYNAPVAKAINIMKDLYADMVGVDGALRFSRAWARGRAGKTEMTYQQFRDEVGKTAITGIPHQNKYVQKAADQWMAKVFEPLRKKGLQSEVLHKIYEHPKRGRVLFAMYDYQNIMRKGTQFSDEVTSWLVNSRLAPNSALAKAIANEVRDDVLSLVNSTGAPKEVMARVPTQHGSMNVPVPAELLQPWMLNDVEMMGRTFTRRMATEIEIMDKFGDSNLVEQFGDINKHYEKLMAKEGADVEMLRKRRIQDNRDLRSLLSIYRNTYGLPSDPTSGLVRAGRALRTWQYVTSLGMQMLSAAPDIARPVVTNGVIPYLKGLTKFALLNPKMARADINELGVGLDMTLHGRVQAMADVLDQPFVYGALEHGSDVMAGTFGKISLMDPWNSFFKQLTGVMAANRIYKMADKGWANITKKQQEQLLSFSINGLDLAKIRTQIRQHGYKEKGFIVGNVQLWGQSDNLLVRTEGEYARNLVAAAVNKEADTVIITAGKSDRPLLFHTEAGKTVGQFMSFITSATNRMLLSGVSQRDMNVLNSVIGGLMIGAMTVYVKRLASGAPMPDSEAEWAGLAIGQAGILGLPGEAIGFGADVLGRGIHFKSAKEVLAERIIGASLSTVANVTTIARGAGGLAFGEQWKEHQTRAMRNLIPYQNVWYLRKLFDVSEEGVNKAIGAKPSAIRKKTSGARPMAPL